MLFPPEQRRAKHAAHVFHPPQPVCRDWPAQNRVRQFQALFQSLPSDSWIKTAISWRGTNLNDITDAKERARYARIKQQWALDPVDYEAEYDAAMERRSMNGCSNFG